MPPLADSTGGNHTASRSARWQSIGQCSNRRGLSRNAVIIILQALERGEYAAVKELVARLPAGPKLKADVDCCIDGNPSRPPPSPCSTLMGMRMEEACWVAAIE